jgi:hypothetical protein
MEYGDTYLYIVCVCVCTDIYRYEYMRMYVYIHIHIDRYIKPTKVVRSFRNFCNKLPMICKLCRNVYHRLKLLSRRAVGKY